MNREEYEAHLADYLGNELDAARRAEFEEFLSANADARAEVEELRATLDDLAHLQTLAEVPAGSAVSTPQSEPAAGNRTLRFFTSLLKAAAVLMFGVLLGRATAPPPATPGTGAPVAPSTLANAGPVHPGWVELARNVDAHPGALAGSLRMFANLSR